MRGEVVERQCLLAVQLAAEAHTTRQGGSIGASVFDDDADAMRAEQGPDLIKASSRQCHVPWMEFCAGYDSRLAEG